MFGRLVRAMPATLTLLVLIVVVGIVGLLLEQMLLLVAKRFEYQG